MLLLSTHSAKVIQMNLFMIYSDLGTFVMGVCKTKFGKTLLIMHRCTLHCTHDQRPSRFSCFGFIPKSGFHSVNPNPQLNQRWVEITDRKVEYWFQLLPSRLHVCNLNLLYYWKQSDGLNSALVRRSFFRVTHNAIHKLL